MKIHLYTFQASYIFSVINNSQLHICVFSWAVYEYEDLLVVAYLAGYPVSSSSKNGHEKRPGYPQCCGSGSVLDPYSGALCIRIRIRNTDPFPDPHMKIEDKLEAKGVRFKPKITILQRLN